MKKYIIRFLCIAFLFTACSKKNEKNNDDCREAFGKTFNNERQKRGITLIPTYWACLGISNKYISYQQKDLGYVDLPYYSCKSLEFENDELICELDQFYGIDKYPADADNPSAMNTQYVEVSYDYEKERKGVYPWSVLFMHCNLGIHNFANYDMLALADSVIKSWGLSRLTYPYKEDTAIWERNKIIVDSIEFNY